MWRKKIALIISWIAVLTVLFLNTHDVLKYKFTKISFLVFCYLFVHLVSLITKRFTIAFRLAMGEIITLIFVLFVLLYPGEGATEHIPFKLAIYLWFFGGTLLTIAAWICNSAINDLKETVPRKNTGE